MFCVHCLSHHGSYGCRYCKVCDKRVTSPNHARTNVEHAFNAADPSGPYLWDAYRAILCSRRGNGVQRAMWRREARRLIHASNAAVAFAGAFK